MENSSRSEPRTDFGSKSAGSIPLYTTWTFSFTCPNWEAVAFETHIIFLTHRNPESVFMRNFMSLPRCMFLTCQITGIEFLFPTNAPTILARVPLQ